MNKKQLDRAYQLQERLIQLLEDFAETDGTDLLDWVTSDVAQLAVDEGLIDGYPVSDAEYPRWVEVLCWHTLRAWGFNAYHSHTGEKNKVTVDKLCPQHLHPELAEVIGPELRYLTAALVGSLQNWSARQKGGGHIKEWWPRPVGLTAIATYLANLADFHATADGDPPRRPFCLQPRRYWFLDGDLNLIWPSGLTPLDRDKEEAQRDQIKWETKIRGPRLPFRSGKSETMDVRRWSKHLPQVLDEHPDATAKRIRDTWTKDKSTPGGRLKALSGSEHRPAETTLRTKLKELRS